MTIAVQIIAIFFMLTLMFIGIWSFIIANKAYNQFKYKNYLLEKMANQLAIITEKILGDDSNDSKNIETTSQEEDIESTSFISEDEILNCSKELIDSPHLFEDIKED
ncbi:MAG: hypothetical protein ACRC6T_14865 [Sarcina sp.]